MTASTDTQPTTVIDPSGEKHAAAKPVRQSRATKSAARNKAAGTPATVTKITRQRESIAVNRDGEPKAAKGDGTNGLKVKIADAMIKFVAEQFVTREMAKQIGVDYALLAAEASRTLSYAPGSAWAKNLVSPGTGRGKRHSL
jgi:hypothetical protein